MMRLVSWLLILSGILSGLLGVRSYWRDYTYEKASTVVKATVHSVKVQPFSGKAVAAIHIVLLYMHDGVVKRTTHHFTKEFSETRPLPTATHLKNTTFYVHYVPKDKSSETAYPERVIVSSQSCYEGFYKRSLFGQTLVLLLLGFLLRAFSDRKQH